MARRKKMTHYRTELPVCIRLLGIPRVTRRYGYSEKAALRSVFAKDGGYQLDKKKIDKAQEEIRVTEREETYEESFERRLYSAYKDMQSQINKPGSKVKIAPYIVGETYD